MLVALHITLEIYNILILYVSSDLYLYLSNTYVSSCRETSVSRALPGAWILPPGRNPGGYGFSRTPLLVGSFPGPEARLTIVLAPRYRPGDGGQTLINPVPRQP